MSTENRGYLFAAGWAFVTSAWAFAAHTPAGYIVSAFALFYTFSNAAKALS